MNLGVLLLLTVVALAAIMIGSSVYFSYLTNKMLFTQLRDLDDVRTNGLPPERWQRGYLKKGRRNGKIEEKDWARQKKKNLSALKKLTHFAKTTNMMEDEQTREGVLEELAVIKKTWESEEYTQ